jgi:Domain of unknown function (DUF4091)
MTLSGIVALSAAALLFASEGEPRPATPEPWARALSPFVKVRPGASPEGSPVARISLARGECEGIQIYAEPPARKVDAKVLPLRGPGARLVPRLYREGYIRVVTPSNSEGEPGLWPDPLIPVEDPYTEERRNALPWDSTKQEPLILYVELCAPGDQRPGTYTGTVELTSPDRPSAKVQLEAQVQPFQIPATSSLPNTFGTSIFSIAQGHKVDAMKPEGRELLHRYAQSALAHRISLHGMSIDPPPTKWRDGKFEVDFTAYDEEMAPFLEGTALPSGARFTTAEIRKNPFLKTSGEREAYIRAYREHFAEQGWKDVRLFFYAKDEPKLEDRALVQRESREARAAGVPVLVTAPLDEVFTPAADIVTPTLNCFYARSGPRTCGVITAPKALRRAAGKEKEIWWYQACPSHGCDAGPFEDRKTERAFSGWASYMVDHPVTLNRAMGVLDWLADVDGELYYATVYAYNFRDPWIEGVWDFGGNGDGTLFYPGTPRHIGGKTHVPVESLRLKHLRDGLEDYEYLHLLEKLGDGAFARKQAGKLARSGYEITRDPETWVQVRSTLTGRLVELSRKSEYREPSSVGPRERSRKEPR